MSSIEFDSSEDSSSSKLNHQKNLLNIEFESSITKYNRKFFKRVYIMQYRKRSINVIDIRFDVKFFHFFVDCSSSFRKILEQKRKTSKQTYFFCANDLYETKLMFETVLKIKSYKFLIHHENINQRKRFFCNVLRTCLIRKSIDKWFDRKNDLTNMSKSTNYVFISINERRD